MTRSTSDEETNATRNRRRRRVAPFRTRCRTWPRRSATVEKVRITRSRSSQEAAEGIHPPGTDGGREWREPDEENCHVEFAVRDGDDIVLQVFEPDSAGIRRTLTTALT